MPAAPPLHFLLHFPRARPGSDSDFDSDPVVGTWRSIRPEARSVDIPGAGRNRSRDRCERLARCVGIVNPTRRVPDGRRGQTVRSGFRSDFRCDFHSEIRSVTRRCSRCGVRCELRPCRSAHSARDRPGLRFLHDVRGDGAVRGSHALYPCPGRYRALPQKPCPVVPPHPLSCRLRQAVRRYQSRDPLPNRCADAPPPPDDSPGSLHPGPHPAVPDP